MAKAAIQTKLAETARPGTGVVAPAHLALADALEAAGRGLEAIAIYQAALRERGATRLASA